MERSLFSFILMLLLVALLGSRGRASVSVDACEATVATGRMHGLLARVIEAEILSLEDWAQLLQSLRSGQWKNLEIWSRAHDVTGSIHLHLLRGAIEASDKDETQRLIRALLEKRHGEAVLRERVQTITQHTNPRMTFIPVYPKKFRRWKSLGSQGGLHWEWKTPRHGFEIASIPVTQFQYLIAMGSVPDGSVGQFDDVARAVEINGQKIFPDHPMAALTFFQAAGFVSRLNELATENSETLHEIVSGHEDGDFYDLLTSEMWDQALSQVDDLDLNREGFYRNQQPLAEWSEPDWTRLPISERAPLILNGMRIYDFIGPLKTWTRTVVGGGIPDGRLAYVLRYESVVIRGVNITAGMINWRLADTFYSNDLRQYHWARLTLRVVRRRGLSPLRKVWAAQRLRSMSHPFAR